MSFARGDATAGDRERASKPSSLKKHVNESPAEGERDGGSRPRDAEPSQHTGAEGGQKQLTLSVCKKQKNPPKSVIERPVELVVPAQHPDADACAGFGARGQTITYHQAGKNGLNPAGAALAVSGPFPPTAISGSWARPARSTLKTVGAEAAVRYEHD